MTVDEFIKKWTAENPLEKAAKDTSEGALCGEFLIGENKKIRFSKGNLQFNASEGSHKTADGILKPGIWRFAEHQWDTIGNGNKENSPGYAGFVDLFGWGTSGWKSGAIGYQPYSTSSSYNEYFPGNASKNNLIGKYKNADWGVYNPISNGGNQSGQWRTLTTYEWKYLFQHNKWSMGTIDGKLCFLLIPDKVSVHFKILRGGEEGWQGNSTDYLGNTFTAEKFKKYEDQGVVALPCGGRRSGASLYDVGSYGYYWSSSANNDYSAYDFFFHSEGVNSSDNRNRCYGCSVRLVQDV